MAELTKKQQPKDADGNVMPVSATPGAVRRDAAAAAPKADELQKRREAVADAGLAHGSLNNYVPMSKEEYSDSEVKGDTARVFPDNVSEQTRRANKENDESQGINTTPGSRAVPSKPLREPGVEDSATAELPEGASEPSDTVEPSDNASVRGLEEDEGDEGADSDGDNSSDDSDDNEQPQRSRESGSKPLSKQNRDELNATAKSRGVKNPEQYKTKDEIIKAIREKRQG